MTGRDMIRQGMEVLGSDGGMVGRVMGLHESHIHVEPTAPVHGGDHVVPLKWIARVDDHVHLDRNAALVRDTWGSGEGHEIPSAAAHSSALNDGGRADRHPAGREGGKSWIVWAIGAILLLIIVLLGIRGFGYAASDTDREQPAIEAPDA